MAKKINEEVIEDDFDQYGIRYGDGEVLLMADEIDVDDALRAAQTVVPDVDMTKVRRHVYITEWVEHS